MADTSLSEHCLASYFTHLLEIEWTFQKSTFDWHRCYHIAMQRWRHVFYIWPFFSTSRRKLLKPANVPSSLDVVLHDYKFLKNYMRAFWNKIRLNIFIKKIKYSPYICLFVDTNIFLADWVTFFTTYYTCDIGLLSVRVFWNC